MSKLIELSESRECLLTISKMAHEESTLLVLLFLHQRGRYRYCSSFHCPLMGRNFLKQIKKTLIVFVGSLVSMGAVLSSGSNWFGNIFIFWSRMIVVAGVINFWSNLPLLAWKSYMTLLLPCRMLQHDCVSVGTKLQAKVQLFRP